jgi:hypothetical protein
VVQLTPAFEPQRKRVLLTPATTAARNACTDDPSDGLSRA